MWNEQQVASKRYPIESTEWREIFVKIGGPNEVKEDRQLNHSESNSVVDQHVKLGNSKAFSVVSLCVSTYVQPFTK